MILSGFIWDSSSLDAGILASVGGETALWLQENTAGEVIYVVNQGQGQSNQCLDSLSAGESDCSDMGCGSFTAELFYAHCFDMFAARL